MHHLRSLRRGEAAVQEEPVAGGLKSATAYTSSEGCLPSHLPSPGNSIPRGRRDQTYISRNKSTQKRNPATTTNVAGPGPDNSTLRLVGNLLTRRKMQGTSGPKQGRLGDWKAIQFEHGMEGGSGLKVIRQLSGQTSVDAIPTTVHKGISRSGPPTNVSRDIVSAEAEASCW